jgi:tripeptide aminopeptidase
MQALSSYSFTAHTRFLRYVTIDTQSDPYSSSCPSTEKQKDLGKVLVEELLAMGIVDAHVDEHGYVYATLPSNTSKQVPVLCYCSHMDTSPDCSGAGVKPIIHKNYHGQDLVLPDDPKQVICLAEHPDLNEQLGNDIITASGTTLLGADNKAGLAEIMDCVHFLLNNPEIKHGTIKLLFTPDEEIGRGVNKVDLQKLGAEVAYTVDGETLGSLENETFSADGAVIRIAGVASHPGFAKGKMESALKIAAELIAALPKNESSPESTEGKQGFIHPVAIKGSVEEAIIELILRDFTDEGLVAHANYLRKLTEEVLKAYPNATYNLKTTEQYRNMKQVLDQHPKLTELGLEAIRRAGISPKLQSIRGGTDGSRLSFMGLPCPNIFAGEHAFHSKLEWVSVQDMHKAVETLVHLAVLWEEKS